MKTTTATRCLLVLLSVVLARAASEVNSGEGSRGTFLASSLGQAARYGHKEMANTSYGDHTSKSAPTAAPAAAPLNLTGDGSMRHLQGYEWVDQSRWPHGDKNKASTGHLYSDYIDVQGPFPAPAAAPASTSGVDASIAAAPAPSGDGSKRLLLGLVNAAASSWSNEDKDKADIQDNASETTAASI